MDFEVAVTIDYQGLVTQGLAKQISDKIRDAILEGRLQVSERLPTEEELATRFNVSRPTIREALKRLASLHLIRTRRGPAGGTFVNSPTRDEARYSVATAAALLASIGEFSSDQMAEARHELESVCCRLAARRRTKAHLDALALEIERQKRAMSDEEFWASDLRFHRTLIEAAGNPALDFIAAGVMESLLPAVNRGFETCDRELVARQHECLHRALERCDADAACGALTGYMTALRGSRAARGMRKPSRE
jgi:DNA-binding FadR family transcriptional regulator